MVNLRIPRTATFAWSEESARPLIATGTVAGAVDADFSNATHLELWDLDLDSGVSEASELSPRVSITTDSRFYDIAWGKRGIIAGALESGALNLWNANSLLRGDEGALETPPKKHTGAIKALQFNPFKEELLLTAGVGGEIYVWDLNNTDNPSLWGNRAQRADDFSSVDWNKKIPHILLSGGKNGLVTVWDVKQKKESLTLSHLGRKEVSAVAWHPENATKLLTALPDDSNPVIMVWDLRNANAPEKILTGHDQGVLSLDWCKQDPDILLSSGKDNRTICWNPNSGEILGEFPIGTNWMFQTRLNPRNPNFMASASFDGKINIQSLQNKTQGTKGDSSSGALDGEDFFNQASFDPQGPSFSLKQAPRWYKRPVGASFGFGGKLVSFGTPAGQQKSSLKITTLAVESDVRAATDDFENSLRLGNFVGLCEKRIDEASSDNEKAEWTILKTLFDPSLKTKLTEVLGFAADPSTDALKTEGEESGEKPEDAQTNGDPKEARRLSSFFGDGGAEDDAFLTELSSTKGARTNNPFNIFGGDESDADKAITKSLILGNFERAVEICINEDRLSDAFMLAVAGGETSLKKVQKAYFSKQANAPNYLRLLASVVEKNLWDVVYNADLADWKEVLCTICTFAEDKEFSELCEALGERLEGEQKAGAIERRQDAATCYLSGSRLNKIVAIWIDEYKENEAAILRDASEGATSFSIHVKSMQQLIEKVSVFREATKFVDPDINATTDWKLAPLYDIYCEYADVLASQGQLDFAAKYLDLVPAKYQPAQIARNRVNIASGKDSSKRTAATTAARQPAAGATARTATKSPYMPVTAQQQPQTGMKMFTPSAPVATPPVVPQPQPQPSMGYQPPSSQPSTSRYTPASTTSSTPAYQPSTTASSGFGYRPPYGGYPSGPQATGFGAPPRTSSPAGPPVLPAAQRTDLAAWNDTPAVISHTRRKTPSIPAAAPITAPFPGAQRVASPSPTTGHFVGPPPRSGASSMPPRPGQFAEPPPSGPTMFRPQTPGSLSQSPYGAQYPSQSTASSTPPPPRPNAAYATPPIATGPPSNRYAPQQSTQPNNAIPPAGPAGRGIMPPPTNHAYAPPPAQTPYGQPPQQIYPPPHQAQGPPPMAGPPMTGPPPMAGPPQGPPPRGSSTTGSRPEIGSSHPPPPKSATPAQKYPKGDRSHIPEHSRLLFEILEEEMQRVTTNAPPDYQTQVQQLGKRLSAFLDHLNNDDLLTQDTVGALTTAFVHVRNKNFAEASNVYSNVPQQELGGFGAVHKKLIQLSEFAQQ